MMQMRLFFLSLVVLFVSCHRSVPATGYNKGEDGLLTKEVKDYSSGSLDSVVLENDVTLWETGVSDVSSSFSSSKPLDIEFFSVKGNVVFRNTCFPLGDIPAAELDMGTDRERRGYMLIEGTDKIWSASDRGRK